MTWLKEKAQIQFFPPFSVLLTIENHSEILQFWISCINTHLIPLSAAPCSDQTGKINNGLVQLTAVSRTDLSQHRPLSASVALPWRCEALEGTVQVKPAVGDLQFFFIFLLHLKDGGTAIYVPLLGLLRHERHFAGRIPEALLVRQLPGVHAAGEVERLLRSWRWALPHPPPGLRRPSWDGTRAHGGTATAGFPRQLGRACDGWQGQRALWSGLLSPVCFG